MAALATIFVEPRAAERFAANIDGTLRQAGATSTDIIIETLSLTGLSASAVMGVGLSDAVCIDLPGLGMRSAKVVRVANGRIGCEFLIPLEVAELIRTLDRTTIKPSPIQEKLFAANDIDQPEPAITPFPRWARGGLAITLGVASWASVIGLLKLI